jgi:hypothetical protein
VQAPAIRRLTLDGRSILWLAHMTITPDRFLA